VHTTPESLADVIRSQSALPVRTVRDRAQLRSGTVFVVAGEQTAEVEGNLIRSTARRSHRSGVPDHLIASAACSFGDRLITVILPETDAPTAALTQQVKEHGGTVLLATSDSGATGGPLPLIPTTVDVTADLDEIAVALQSIVAQADAHDSMAPHSPEPSPIDATHDPHDFEFFRDPELFGYLRETILPDLVARARSRGAELRLWSAGCATGEEAYSLAILLAEVLGEELDRFTVRLFATDLDEEAVQFARRGIYPQAALGAVSPERLAQYFVKTDGAYEVSKRIRAMIIFGQHDLGARAPFPRIDLVLCRNVLIYFTPELQRRALQLFAFSLRDGGVLVLGKAETVDAPADQFAPAEPGFSTYRRHGERIVVMPLRRGSGWTAAWPSARVSPALNLPPRSRTSGETGTSPRLDSVFQHLPVGIVVVDRRYRIQAINPAARRMLGLHSAAIEEDVIHLCGRIDAGALRRAIDGALRGDHAVFMHEGQGSDDDARPLHDLRVSCVATSEGAQRPPAVTILLEDVSDLVRQRIEAEVAVEHERSTASRLSESQRATNEVNTELADANDQLSRINLDLMSANEELAVERQEALTAMEEIQVLNEELISTNEELESLTQEQGATLAELNRTNGDLDARSHELQQLSKSLERQRHVSEAERARLSAILLSVGDPIVVVDAQGTPVLANPAYDRVFGRGPGLFLALDAAGRLLLPKEHPLQRAARGESFTVEFTTTAPDGSRRRCEATGEPVPDGGRERGVVVIRDVTERSVYHIQDEFLALASHELRTPLSAVLVYLELLEQRTQTGAGAELHRFAERALHQAQRLKDLTGDLLDATRLQHGKLALRMRMLDLGETAERAVEAAQAMASAPAIRLTRAPEAISIHGDPSRIEQVILNLLSNAVAHAGGSEEIQVQLQRKDSWAEVVVQDFGEGIAPEELPFVFDRFRQVRREREFTGQGLGLGLYIAKEIVTAHGGSIDVESEPGHGATFTVRLPLTSASTVPLR
jgi:two-component system CheB/CheR fusion protein